MSSHDEDRLTRGLRDRAGDVSGAPVGLDEVKRTARGLRRRRRITSGLVAAAVVAIVVPVGLNAAGSTNAHRPVAPATTSPSGTPTRAGTPEPTPTLPNAEGVVPLTAVTAAAGDPAKIGYLKGRTYVAADGTRRDLPAAYDTVAPYRGGWLAVQRKQGTTYVVQIDASGNIVSSQQGGDRIVVSDDGLEVSWVADGKAFLDTTNGHSESPQSIDLPTGSDASPVGFVAPGSVLVRVGPPGPDYWVTDFSDHRVLQGNFLAVRATNMQRGLLGVKTSYNHDDGTSCWKVATNQGGDREPETCDWTTQAFSPNGAHVAGYPSDADGQGSPTVALLDAGTLNVVARFERVGNGETHVADVAWEDDSHLLATLYEDGSWHLVRLGLDGSIQTLDETPGPPEDSPFRFAAHP
jgi:hypothetical protein